MITTIHVVDHEIVMNIKVVEIEYDDSEKSDIIVMPTRAWKHLRNNLHASVKVVEA